MEVAASSTCSTPGMKAVSSSSCDTDHMPAGPRFRHNSECSDSAASSSDVIPATPAAAGSYLGALLWHGDDNETTDDQDVGWQLVAGKASGKVHQPTPSTLSTASSVNSSTKGTVCGRCGMRGHLRDRCRQPHCSLCSKWWHMADECSRACSSCGALDHKSGPGHPMCKNYKCRECGLYGHVYAECPNIRCNLCSEIGHKALDCPSIVCNICKQKGHKAIHCPQAGRGPAATVAAVACASKPIAACGPDQAQQHLQVVAPGPSQLQHANSSCSSVPSPMSASPPAGAGQAVAAATPVATTSDCGVAPEQPEVPLLQQQPRPTSLQEQQLLQQQHSQLLGQLFKVAPEVAVACLDDPGKLHALYTIEPQHMHKLLQDQQEHSPEQHRSVLQATICSAAQQLQQRHVEQQQQAGQLLTPTRPAQQQAGASLQQVQPRQRLQMLAASATARGAGRSAPSSPAAPASPAATGSGDETDATQGIKPGDLAPQHAKQLLAEFGDMLPSRWQQLPSWRQLEARLSFPDGNYVQRRLQFRERRRQLQVLTLQLRAAAAAKQPQHVACKLGVAAVPSSPAATKGRGALVAPTPANTPQQPPQQQQQQSLSRLGGGPCSYAAALSGRRASGSGAGAGSSSSSAAASPAPAVEAGGVAVCSRCGMLGHPAASCAQPRCSSCHLWWHTETQCNRACQFCGSLDHAGDAEQPASCRSFRCKVCKMFGHTATICPHVQMHTNAQRLQQQQGQQLLLQRGTDHQQEQVVSESRAASTSPAAAAGVPLSSSLGKASTQSGFLDCAGSVCPPDSPGVGQQGVKPKDLLPEHAKALQEEFPNALPPGWQQMGSWRMVEERLRVVAVEGAVFSKRRQMWRDRRKHYQALTAQALAGAARSAAAAAGAAGSSGKTVGQAPENSSHTSTADCVEVVGAVLEESSLQQGQQQQPQVGTDQLEAHGPIEPQQVPGELVASGKQVEEQQQAVNGLQELPQVQQDQQQAVMQQQQAAAQGPLNEANVTPVSTAVQLGHVQNAVKPVLQHQKQLDDQLLVPEWQQQQGSLFSLVDAAALSMPLTSGTAGSSSFSCDTTFCSSPAPADTPSVMLSPLPPDLRMALSSTPGQALPGTPSSAPNPAGTMGSNVRRQLVPVGSAGLVVPAGPLSGMPMSSPMPSMVRGTPIPNPRGGPAAGSCLVNGAGVGMAMQEVRSPAPTYSPVPALVQHVPAALARSPLDYSCPPPSPMVMEAQLASAGLAAPAGRAQLLGVGPTPAAHSMYQQMMIAQRQSQLQQQLMMPSPYNRQIEPNHSLASQQQQVLMHMQMQQQQQQQAAAAAAQQQMRMQRQRRMDQAFMLQQQQQRLKQDAAGPLLPADEFGETGELDDKLGVLGVLGLQ